MNSKIKIYAFYYIIEENILTRNDFKNILLDELKKEKNKLINNLAEEMEKKSKKMNRKIEKNNRFKGI